LSNILLKAGLAYEAFKSVLGSGTKNPLDKNTAVIADSENFFEVFGSNVFFEYVGGNKAEKYYRECPPLSYILNKKASFVANGIVSATKVNGKELRGIEGAEFLKILEYPNPIQTFKQFQAQVDLYTDLYGWCFIVKIVPDGMDAIPSELWVLPPHMLDIKKNDKYLFVDDLMEMIDSIYFNYAGVRIEISKDDVYLFTGETSSTSDLLFPNSKLYSLKYPINNLIKNYESRGVIIEKRGALGILSPENDSLGQIRATKEDKDQLQKDYAKYGLLNNQYQLIISNIAMRWSPMSMNVRDLQLLEFAKDDIGILCDAFGFEPSLLSTFNDNKFNNKNEAKKSQYQDSAIPQANNFVNQLNDMMNAQENGVIYKVDFSHVPVLQDDQKLKSETHKNNVESITKQLVCNLITYGNAMLKLGEEPPTKLSNLYFYELPTEIQQTFKINTNGTNNQGNQGNSEGQGNNNQN
jgi:hypothetical protein